MTGSAFWVSAGVLGHIGLQVAFIIRALLRPHRQPSSRIAWVLVILALPVLGALAYFLFGDTNIGHGRAKRYRKAAAAVSELRKSHASRDGMDGVAAAHRHLFRLGQSISGFQPVAGNSAEIMAGSNATIDRLVADIDDAQSSIHLLFYIWLADTNGTKVVEAAKRAARRGVIVRAMVDAVGSRGLVRSNHWRDMEAAGVRLARALPVRNPFLHPLGGRLDLRNHRKIVVIDDHITYCGSQNCADPEFRVKARYAPWVDLMVRFTGPVALQNLALFAEDWVSHTDERLPDVVSRPVAVDEAPTGVVAQVIGTGPTERLSAIPEMFEALMHAARHTLTVTTPYYVPSEAMQSALCSAGHRGVETTLVLPARNDSWVVAASSRSYYADLVAAGVRIFEYRPGLLHAKTLTLDDEVALIGSANLDRRSFDLNYENSIVIQDREFVSGVRDRQAAFIADSRPVLAAEIEGWSNLRRLRNNAIAMLGPIL
jgi:cardiolipin synthase